MANVTIVPPSAQVQTVAAAGGQQAKGSLTLNLSPGSIISGTIIGKDGGGNFLLRTSQGTISLQSSTPLTYNSDVVIQTGSGGTGGTTTARIISVNGEPFAAFAAPEPESSDTISPALQTQALAAPAAPPATTAIRAVIVAAPTAEQVLSNTQAGDDNSQPVSGTNVIIRLTSAPQTTTQQATLVTTPQPAAGSGNQTGSSSVQAHAQMQQLVEDTTPANVAKLVAPQPAALQQNAPAPAAAAPQSAEEELAAAPSGSPAATSPAAPATPPNALYATYTKQAGGPVTTTAPAAIPAPATATPVPAAAPPAPSAAANTLQGQVVATNADASTATIQTPVGAVIVKADPSPAASAVLLPATNVSIELPANSALLTILTQTPLAQMLNSSTPAPLSELAASWQTLGEIVDLVAANNAPAATALLARLPQLGPDFMTSTASFITALAGGNARKLLGDDAIDTLQQNGRLDLLQKFTGEMNGLSDAYMSPSARQAPGWQPLFLPFVYQEELQQARLYVKREPSKKGGKSGKSSNDTRFVVEVDLSELGPMQMDGLVRDRQQSTMFDLIIRSRTAFSANDQAEISDIYNNAAELTGFKGTVAFQVTYDFPVKPLDEILADASHGIII